MERRFRASPEETRCCRQNQPHALRGVLTLSLGSPWMSLSTTYIHVYIREKVCRSQAIHEQASQKLKEHGCLHMTPTHPPPRAQEVLQAKSTTCAESCTHALSWEPFGGSLLSVPVTKCATRTLQKCAMRSTSFAVNHAVGFVFRLEPHRASHCCIAAIPTFVWCDQCRAVMSRALALHYGSLSRPCCVHTCCCRGI